MSDQLEQQVEAYLRFERNDQFRNAVSELKRLGNTKELQRLFGGRLTFGTAGIRGPMGPGFNRINDLVVVQTIQGLVSYMLETHGQSSCSERGIIIGHDARHHSSRFARLAVLACLQRQLPVFFCDQPMPTPLVARGVTHFNCLAGLMVTASHNPKQDNGLKVFWCNGAQILTPHDINIQAHIMRRENQEPWSERFSYAHHLINSNASDESCNQDTQLPQEMRQRLNFAYSALEPNYLTYIKTLVATSEPLLLEAPLEVPLEIVYTSMHGVGHKLLTSVLQFATSDSRHLHPVEAQMEPDPEFPTVALPNPEEAGALDLAFATAAATKSTLILALDPDADRCAAGLFDPTSNRQRRLTGNELGQLLGWWAWHLAVSRKARDARPDDCCMLSTAVSSRFLETLARHERFHFVETLTGFKYMGNTAHELLLDGKRVLFAYEEALGFMVDAQILDKDGISAAVQVVRCATYLAALHKRTLGQQLDWLYWNYGYHFSINSYFKCHEPATIRAIFQELQSNYPKSFKIELGEEFVVARVRDLNTGFDDGAPDRKAQLPISASSFMVTFWVGELIRFTIRTSGTEPKIKYYSEIVTAPLRTGSDEWGERAVVALETEKRAAQARLERFLESALERCLRPTFYKLERPAAAAAAVI